MSERCDRSRQEPARGLTRRGFLKGAGVTAAGAAIAESGLAELARAQAEQAVAAVLGPGPTMVTLRINGAEHKVQIEPRTTLAEALRVNLDLTGTKIVCDRGACGGCTVMIDGRTVNSCMTPALDAVGREIRTIEGIAQDQKLHPVQEQFIEHDAMQCGFCTPGMIISCVYLLEHNKNPTLEDVKQACSGNLCRCGTYPKVFEAVLAAAKQV